MSRVALYVFQRKDPPVVVFDREGKYLGAWGSGEVTDPHGLKIVGETVYTTDRSDSVAKSFTLDGKPLLELGQRSQHSLTGAARTRASTTPGARRPSPATPRKPRPRPAASTRPLLRRRQLTEDGNVKITGRDLRERTPPVGQGSLFGETGSARVL